MKPEVIVTPYQHLGGLIWASERAGNPMRETHDTYWFRIGQEACCGVFMGVHPPRWKAVYVDPAFRLQGYARAMLERVCEFLNRQRIDRIQAMSGTPDYLKALGFVHVKTTRGKWVGERSTNVQPTL